MDNIIKIETDVWKLVNDRFEQFQSNVAKMIHRNHFEGFDDLVDDDELCKLLNMSKSSLMRQRKDKILPPSFSVKGSHKLLNNTKEIEEILFKNHVTMTKDFFITAKCNYLCRNK